MEVALRSSDAFRYPSELDLHLDYQRLSEKFFNGMRNELTFHRLKKLASFARAIPEPNRIGRFNDELHYAKTLSLMLRSTSETRHLGLFFRRHILPSLLNKHSLLDVGPGDGQLTGWVGNHFRELTAVDNNQAVLDALNVKQKILRKKTSLTKCYDSVLDVQLAENTYDLALLSHVLYYVDSADWSLVVDDMLKTVKPGGKLVIALSGDAMGKARLIEYFGGDRLDIDTLSVACLAKYGEANVDTFSSKESVLGLDLNVMLHISGLFLYDKEVTASRWDILEYLERYHQHPDGYFEMTTQQKVIVIHKK